MKGVDGVENFEEFFSVFVRWKECEKCGVVQSADMIDDDTIKQVWKRENAEHRKLWPTSPIRWITVEKIVAPGKSYVAKRYYFDEAGEIVKTRNG